MRGASRITVVFGGVLVAAAWAVGRFELLAPHRTITDILAEVIAFPLFLLAWRYRRDRLAVAALLIAAANVLVRTSRITAVDGAAIAVLTLTMSLILIVLVLVKDRPLWRPMGMIWFAMVASGIWIAAVGVRFFDERALKWLMIPGLVEGSIATAGVIVLIGFAVRRGAFEGSLVWVVIAGAAAILGGERPANAALFFTAAQLALLVGLFEDSYRLAFHDELTGLPCRRALDEAMRSLSGTFTIAMVDIDHFKRFNDRHGHDAGDQVLRMVADELAGTGGGGRAHRYGGEEFAIVFPAKDATKVREDLEKLRSSIADRSFALRASDRPKTKPDKPRTKARPAKRVTVTVSIGAADSNSRRSSPPSVLKAADNALYRAKRAGRNRLVVAGDRLPKKR